jgi:hypothetical protein
VRSLGLATFLVLVTFILPFAGAAPVGSRMPNDVLLYVNWLSTRAA